MIEFIRFDSAFQLAIHFIGQGCITQPPAPAIAGTDMDPQLSGDAPRRTRQAQEKGGKDPMRERPLALGEQRVGEVIEGTPTAMAPIAFNPGR
jgi:hypothetical protein